MRHRVYVKNPHISSLGASVLLRRKLRDLQLQQWLDFRADYLARKRLEHGDLVCEYCGKLGLVEEGPNSIIATIDHVHPRSKGGAEYDENNLKVACYRCNNKKADKVLAV